MTVPAEKQVSLLSTRFEPLLSRHPTNPILTSKDWPYPINSVFNAGATLLADGTTLLAASQGDGQGNPGAIYFSTNFGVNWFQTSAPGQPWLSVACSADATRMAALTQDLPGGSTFISTNLGVSWTQSLTPAGPWQSLALSADGRSLLGLGAQGLYALGSSNQAPVKMNTPRLNIGHF